MNLAARIAIVIARLAVISLGLALLAALLLVVYWGVSSLFEGVYE